MTKEDVQCILVYLGDIQEKKKALRFELECEVCREKRRDEAVQQLALLDQDDAVIRAGLDHIHSRHRKVLMQRYVGRYSWTKIATQMGASEATAKRHGAKAIARLAQSFRCEVMEKVLERAKAGKI